MILKLPNVILDKKSCYLNNPFHGTGKGPIEEDGLTDVVPLDDVIEKKLKT